MNRIILSFTFIFFMFSDVFSSGKDSNMPGLSSSSSSSSTSTSLTPPDQNSDVDQGEVLVYTLSETLEMLNRLTVENLPKGIKLFPSALLFKLNHYIITHPNLSQENRRDLTHHLVFTTLFFLEMVEATEFSRDAIDLILSLLKTLDPKKLAPQKEALLKKSFTNAHKISTLKISDIYKAFFSDSKTQLQNSFQHVKSLLAGQCNVEATKSGTPFFNRNLVAQNRQALELGAFFDVQTSRNELYDEMTADQDSQERNEYERNVKLLRFSRLPNVAHNYSALLSRQNNFFEATRWKSFAYPHKKKQITRLDAEASAEFGKTFFGSGGLNAFMQRAEKKQLSPDEHLATIKKLVDAENPDPSDILLYAQKLLDYGRKKEAREWGVKAAEAGKEKGYMIAAECAVHVREDHAVEAYLSRIKDQSVVDQFGHLIWGEALYMLRRFEEARPHFVKSLRDYPEAYYFLGDIESDLDKKENLYLLSLQKMKPDNTNVPTALRKLGLIYAQRNQHEKAREYFQRAIDAGEKSISFEIGRSYFREKKFMEAIPHFVTASESPDPVNKWRKRESLAYIGDCYRLMNDVSLAEKFYNKAVKAGARHELIHLAQLAEGSDDLEKAEMYLRQAVKKHVKDAQHYLTFFLQRHDKVAEAAKEMTYVIADLSEEEKDEEVQLPKSESTDTYVEVVNSKKYQLMLAKIEKELAEEMQKRPEDRREVEDKSLDDLNITLSSAEVADQISQHEQRVKNLLFALVNGIRAGHFETLSGYDKRCSMRITKGDRLVFDIVEGSINEPVAIVIVSAKGHYKNLTEVEYTEPTEINYNWTAEQE